MRFLLTTAAAALAVLALSGCGDAGGVASVPEPSTGCHASPPDVVSGATAVPPAVGPVTSPLNDREAEANYAGSHSDVSEVGITSPGYDYVGFTTDAQRNLAALRATAPDPARIRAYCALWSDRTLLQVEARLEADHVSLLAQGIDVRMSAPLFSGVEVTVLHPAPDTKARLQSVYGPVIASVIEGTGACCG
jgi:hypothetical protein